MRTAICLLCVIAAVPASAQFTIQTSNTTADLRGIHNVGNGVAWASGTNGTVLRTEDGGYVWQSCSIPPGAEKLDFRSIQAFDANTAIVMSSGPGDQSRLYKTTDGCHTWRLLFTNPDKDGFWDAIQFDEKGYGILLGDPAGGQFAVFISDDKGENWRRQKAEGLAADGTRNGVFAASNSSLVVFSGVAHRFFVTGGSAGALYVECNGELQAGGKPETVECLQSKIPVGHATESSGGFSLALTSSARVVVGGEYTKPNATVESAAWSRDGAKWHPAQTPPHGYRSAVAYDSSTKTWITVGPNGTDISTDDGRNWRPVHPSAAMHEPPDADRNWNALSLPYVVGPHGRIGKFDEAALKP
ncbi:MAG TPA: hypothetical protein VGF82_07790 [Terracidiphilus sp.]